MADANVDVPVIGNVHKEWLYAGLALIVGIVGYAYIKNRASGGAAASTVGSANPDAFQGAALPMSAYDAYGNLVTGQSTTGPPANWALQAVDYLSNVFGYDRQTAGLAIAHYVNGGTLTPAEADIVNIARSVLGNSPDNLPVNIGSTPVTPPPTTTTPPPATSTDPMYQSWDTWLRQQVEQGLYQTDPNGGEDWGLVARNTFGTNADPSRVQVFAKAQQLQSLNPDAAKRYNKYVPVNVAATLKVS